MIDLRLRMYMVGRILRNLQMLDGDQAHLNNILLND